MYTTTTKEPVAIVSSSCRFAGGITTSEKLWQVLSNPPDLARQVPRDRFTAEAFYHSDGTHHGTSNSTKGYWLDQDHRKFDASFFQINCKEAEAMDPQQRMVLEVVYEAMALAGFRLQDYAGKDVAVFAGVMTADYDTLSQHDELQTSQYFATGNARSMIANRISYFFDFRGPSMTIDSACSSSLVAVHQAVQSLRSGESTMACVTGVNLMLTPEHFIVESDMHMLSPSGHCHMWDARADGYARGEGVAAVLLKTLSQAIADGDRVHAVIRETGINSDGRTEGITMPNIAAQATLIRRTYHKAGLDALRAEERCQYFEAHGTGTAVGDPREAAAIKQAFFGMTDEAVSDKLMVGSIKTVVGHTEGAAGLAGLLKVVEALKHKAIPPNLHSDCPSEAVKPFLSHLQVPTQLKAWPQPASGEPRRASVNSFGFGGTNAHAIVESYDESLCGIGQDNNDGDGSGGDDGDAAVDVGREGAAALVRRAVPLCISAASPRALRAVACSFRTLLHNHPSVSIQLLACCLTSRRDALTYRVALSVASREQALAALDRLLDHDTAITRHHTRAVTMDHAPQLLGIFTGQGAQWPTMARSLLRSNSVFQQVIKNLDSVLAACDDPPSWTLADQILADADTSRVHEAAIAQPLCTAIQIALVDLLQSLRITFHTVIGHSSGEIAAAYAAGRLTMRDAMLISYYRGRVISQSLHSTDGFRGGMLAVGLSEKDAFGYCRDGDFTSKLFVAAGNASNMATISGDLEMIKQAKDELDSKQILAKVLRVDAAYHSPHMAAAAADYMKALERCQISPIAGGNGIVWISSVYGFKRTSEKDLGAGYWKDNMLYTVQFHDAVDHALSEYGPYDAAIEIGPHASLKLPVCQTATDCGQGLPYVGILDRTKDDSLAVADCLGFLWSTLGPLELHLSPYIEQTPNKKTISSYLEQLPAYPWDHCYPYYKQSRLSRQRLFRQCSPHELLGVRAPDDDEHVRRWRNVLTLDRLPWLRHHRFQGQSLLPASAYCVMILDACRTLSCNRSPTSVELRDIEIVNGVVIDEAPHGTEVMFTMMTLPVGDITGSSIESSFCLTSCPADGAAGMTLNMTGKARVCFDDDQVASSPLRLPTSRDLRCADSAAFYQMMNLTGLSYTGPFRGVVDIRRRFEYCSAQVANTHESDSTDLMVSPATLDSCFQTAFLTYASPGDKSIWGPLLPCLIGRLYFDLRTIEGMKHTNPAQMLSVEAHLTETHAATPAQPATLAADIAVFGDCGQRAMQVENLVVRAIPNACTNENLTSYLQTVCDLDPEYEIAIMGSSAASDRLDALKGLTDIPQTHITRLCEVVQSTKGTKGTSKHNISEAVNTTNFYNHIGRVVQQISHRHPWMKCLCLPDNSVQLPAHILRKLDGSFRMFTIGLKRGNNSDVCITEKAKTVSQITLDPGRCISTQLVSSNRHDLVILAVSHLERNDWPDLLGTVRNIMKEGGFLVLLHEATGRYNLSRCQTKSGLFTPPDWPDRLMDHSFKSFARHSDQYFPSGHYLMVRQLAVIGPRLPKAMNTSLGASSPGNLIILAHPKGLLGGRVDDLRLQLSAQHARITVRHSIDMVEASVLGACTAVIIVSDEDHPLDTMMARHNLDRFRSMFQPNMKILWVVQNSWSANPGHAAVLGFTRTIAAEVPNLTIQTLDLHDVSSPERHIADAFLKLGMAAEAGDQDDMLWTQESEIYINSGKRLIPRIKPLRETNERALAFRDPLVKRIDLKENVVAIRCRSEGNGVSQFAAEVVNKNLHAISLPGSMVELEHSSVYPICLSPYPLVYVCVGHDTRTGESIVGLTEQNASHVARSSLLHSCVLQPDSVGGRELVAALCRSLVFELVLTLCRHRSLVLINADIELQHMLSNAEAASSLKVAYYTTLKHISQLNDPKHRSWDFHHLSTSREIRQKFLRAGENTTVIDFSVSEDELSRNIRDSLPSGCLYIQAKTSVFGIPPERLMPRAGSLGDMKYWWENALAKSITKRKTDAKTRMKSGHKAISLVGLLADSTRIDLFQVVDWTSEDEIDLPVTPLVEKYMFKPDKTYVLIGLTRDLGQSLCRLLIKHGARNIVLASRNPDLDLDWATELEQRAGAKIIIKKVDVTELDQVTAFKQGLAEQCLLPPVGGLINGAMVLDDRIFAHMTTETWERVMRPKALGSRNLDAVFSNTDLEFFIMTSSFAAIGGHAGQSNYAAANMYMNGLAADRRRRGLAGSVLNIGVIYGLGFLHRERSELYAGLEREGYPPISERDVHHMVLEAIVAGRPHQPDGQPPPYDIIAGLSRFRLDKLDRLHWQQDPRFSHLAIIGSDDSHVDNDLPEPSVPFSDRVAAVTELREVQQLILEEFTQRLEVLLQTRPGLEICQDSRPSELGIDSLLAVDIRNWAAKKLCVDLAVMKILGPSSINKLCCEMARQVLDQRE